MIRIGCLLDQKGGVIAPSFKETGYVVVADAESPQVPAEFDAASLSGEELARRIAEEDCEAVITGPIGDKPFRILADRFQITRYFGAGLSAKEALDLMNRGRLPLITDPDDGTGRIRDPGGHAHRHGG